MTRGVAVAPIGSLPTPTKTRFDLVPKDGTKSRVLALVMAVVAVAVAVVKVKSAPTMHGRSQSQSRTQRKKMRVLMSLWKTS